MTKLQAAISYASRGWKVFPCGANTKIPLAGTHGVKDATCDIGIITSWWTANPEANIGLACGCASNVWVVDIDVRPDKGISGYDSIKASGKDLPSTRIQRTPSGGKHLLYKCDGEKPANKNGFLAGVDIRGDGYYIVVAPSTINGKQYEWVDENEELSEFPDDFKPVSMAGSVFSFVPPACTAPSASSIDRARAYLAEIPGAVEHVDGHSKLFWVAQVLVNGFRLSDDEVERLMWEDYNPRCSPPWEMNQRTINEFKHKIADAHRNPNPSAVAVYDAVNPEFGIDEFDFDKCISDCKDLIYPPTMKVESRKMTKQDWLTHDLMEPEGLVGEISSWINQTAPCYQPKLAIGAALVLCGAIMGRKVCDESNGRTNIYAMGVGPSSSGKDHPGDCINRILTTAGAQNLMMGRMTSDTAIEKALYLSPSKIAILDEVGHFFSNINTAKNDSYLKTIKPTLMELFSSAHKTYIGKEMASKPATVIDQPCMCLWGVTAPEKLYAGMTVEELKDGWIARNLVFITRSFPDIVIKPSADVPSSIVESVRSWMMRSPEELALTASPGMRTKPTVVPMDEKARRCFDAFNKDSRDTLRASQLAEDKTQYLWGKALQNARRVALIIACGREYESPIITQYDAEYGCRLIRHLITDCIDAVKENVNENKFEEDKNRVWKIIASYGCKGVTRGDLCRRTQWIRDKKARANIIEDLSDAGRIRLVALPGFMGVSTKNVLMSAEAADQLDKTIGIEQQQEEP